MPRLIIDQGLKTTDCYEFFPFPLPKKGIAFPSIDIGKLHFGIYIDILVEGKWICGYAGLWKLGEKANTDLMKKLYDRLDKLSPLFSLSRVALVEQQRAMNYVAVRMQQMVLSYFELRHPNVLTINVASDLKYRRLDGPLGDQKHKRKKWAVEKCLEFVIDRDDGVASFIAKLGKDIKADDVSDSLLQKEAWLRTLKPKEVIKYLQE